MAIGRGVEDFKGCFGREDKMTKGMEGEECFVGKWDGMEYEMNAWK